MSLESIEHFFLSLSLWEKVVAGLIAAGVVAAIGWLVRKLTRKAVDISYPGGPISADLEETMSDLLGGLRKALAANPLIRDIIVLREESLPYSWRDAHAMFSEDRHVGIRGRIRVLAHHALVAELRPRFAYRMTEDFVRYLRKS